MALLPADGEGNSHLREILPGAGDDPSNFPLAGIGNGRESGLMDCRFLRAFHCAIALHWL